MKSVNTSAGWRMIHASCSLMPVLLIAFRSRSPTWPWTPLLCLAFTPREHRFTIRRSSIMPWVSPVSWQLSLAAMDSPAFRTRHWSAKFPRCSSTTGTTSTTSRMVADPAVLLTRYASSSRLRWHACSWVPTWSGWSIWTCLRCTSSARRSSAVARCLLCARPVSSSCSISTGTS